MPEETADPLDDGHPHSESAPAIPPGVVDLIELPKDHFQLVCRNSDARIPDFQCNAVGVAPRGQQYTPGPRVPECVLHEVRKNALQEQGIGSDDAARRPEPQREAPRLGITSELLV